jgi:glycosyltransferase involved in cell wall biosynthesis
MKKPLVSVVIPTIPSREQLLKRAIKSVKSQTYQNIEILPVTEGNNACEARNIGISKAKGEFIAFLDDDDTWEPTKIKKQVNEMISHPWCPLCITYSHDLRFGQDRINKPPRVITHREVIKSFNLSSTSTYLVRKYALVIIRKLDGHYFDESLKSAHEYDLAIRITRNGHDVVTVEEDLVIQYATEGQISEDWKAKKEGLKQVYKKHKELFFGVKTRMTYYGIQSLFTLAYLGLGNNIYKLINKVRK